MEFWSLFVLLLLSILALNTIVRRRILGNSGQLVGEVDTNRTAKLTRRKVLPLGLLRLFTINCRCIPKVLGKKERWEKVSSFSLFRTKDKQLANKVKEKITEVYV